MVRLLILLFVISTQAHSVYAQASRCQSLFNRSFELSLSEASEIVANARTKTDFRLLKERKFTKIENMDPRHPDYGDGSGGKTLLKAQLNGRPVVIKQAKLGEIQLAYALSELGIGVKFLGVVDFCDCYVTEFISDAMMIKPHRGDNRIQKLVDKGFRLQEKSKQQMELIIRNLAKIGIVSQDLQFLVNIKGDVFVFDLEPRFLIFVTSIEEALVLAENYISRLRHRFNVIDSHYVK